MTNLEDVLERLRRLEKLQTVEIFLIGILLGEKALEVLPQLLT